MDLITRLIEAGTPAQLVAEVALELGRAQGERDALEKRRSADRERQQGRRERIKAEAEPRHVTSRDVTDVTDSPSLSLPPNENNSNPPTHTHPDNKPAREKLAKPDGVRDQTWRDFLDLRRRKRAPLTETALTGIQREVRKAGWPLEEALAEAVTRGWQSVKADWLTERIPKPAGVGI